MLRTNLKINVVLIDDYHKKTKSKKILIDFASIKISEGLNSLLIIISKKYQIEINKKNFDVEILYMGKWFNLVDLNSFIFFVSSNLHTDEETQLRVTYKGNNKKAEYEDQDMIIANELNMAIYQDKKNTVKCGICHQLSDNEFFIYRLGPFYGPFKYCEQKYYIHLICALWCPQVCISKSNRLVNVAKEIHRAKRDKCSYCGDTGAALGCWLVSENICRKKYHYLCAISDGCYFNKRVYGILCPKHKDDYNIPVPDEDEKNNNNRKKIQESDGIEETLVCSICVLTYDQDNFLQCSRCHKSVHSYCVNYQIVQDDETLNTQDYICSKCTKEIVYQITNKG